MCSKMYSKKKERFVRGAPFLALCGTIRMAGSIKNAKNCRKICVCQKKAVLLHPLFNREHVNMAG